MFALVIKWNISICTRWFTERCWVSGRAETFSHQCSPVSIERERKKNPTNFFLKGNGCFSYCFCFLLQGCRGNKFTISYLRRKQLVQRINWLRHFLLSLTAENQRWNDIFSFQSLCYQNISWTKGQFSINIKDVIIDRICHLQHVSGKSPLPSKTGL